MKSNYDKQPKVQIGVNRKELVKGWEAISEELNNVIRESNKADFIIAIEAYQGADSSEVKNALEKFLKPHNFFACENAFKEEEAVADMVFPYVTNDRIFGYMTDLEMINFFDENKVVALKKKVGEDPSEVKVVYGHGSSLCVDADLLIYLDLARWEIQGRMRRNEVGNMGVSNKDLEISRKYKQSFFVDWRVLDRHKVKIFDRVDYFIDVNKKKYPGMLEGKVYRNALKKVNQQPFRVVPFFDPGPWGGQWMKEVMDLDRSEINFAWSFDCVPEENSLLLAFGDQTFETPAINLVLKEAPQLLGEYVYQKFGAEFPIRFDFLDTMDGGNLSLQVHPDNKYIQKNFGMAYTQDESYYLMDVKEDAVVYLGLKDDVQPDKMIAELQEAQKKGGNFDADKYVGKYPIKKHDHVLIPGGTVHCSGANSVVLEISATPYIFTFKLWDWGRLGLDNLPRPINIEHGEKVIDWSRREEFTKRELINTVEKVAEGDGWVEERTGLYPTVFIETRRHWFTGKVPHNTDGGVNVLNLIEGKEAIVESPDGAFEPFVIHYAETFIVPAGIGHYTIRPYGESEGRRCGTIKAYVRK